MQTLSEPIAFGPLSLVGLETGELAAGKPLPVTLLWQSTQAVDGQLNTSVQLVAEDGSRMAQADGPPANGIMPASLIFDQPVPDFKTLEVPKNLSPGRYRLEVSVYDVPAGGGEDVIPLTEPQPVAWFNTARPWRCRANRSTWYGTNQLSWWGLTSCPKDCKPAIH